MGKVATSPLAVSGIPTAAERGGKSEVAHLWAKWLRHPCRLGDPDCFRAGEKSEVAHFWAKWLRHPCRLGDPHRCRAGGEIRSGATCGKRGYVTPAVSGIPTGAERGGEIRSGPQVGKVATSPMPSRGSPPLQSRGKIRSGPIVGKVATSPLPSRGSPPLQSGGGGMRSGPLVGKVATSPLPSQGSPPLQSGGRNQKWPTYGQSGYVTPAVSGIPTAAERGKNQKWQTCGQSGYVTPAVSGIPTASERGKNQKWPTCGQSGYVTPAVSGIPTAAERGGGEIRSGPQVGNVATSPLPSRGSPPLQSEGENQKWPTSGQNGYVTHAVSGIPTTSEREGKLEVAHLWAKWLRHSCRLGDPHRCRAGAGNQTWPTCGQIGYVTPAVSGIPTAAKRGKNQKWPTCGQSGYVTPVLSGTPTASERGNNQKWPNCGQSGYVTPAVSGIPTAAERGGEIRSGPLVGKVATSPLPSRGSPPVQSGGGNQKWPTSGQSGYVTPAVSGIPTASERGKNQKWPNCGQSGYVTPTVSGIPTAAERGGGGDEKWPTCGQSGYVTPAVSGIATAAERGAESEVAHLWAKWLRHPCRLGDPHRCRAGEKSEVAHLWAKWLRHPCRLGDPHRFRAGEKSEVAHLWAKWLRHPCRLGDPHRCRAGEEIRSGPQVGNVATSPLPSRRSPPLQSEGENQKWPTSGQNGYVTHAVSGIPTTSEREGKLEVAHLWAKWLRHPCRLGDPHRCRAGGEIRRGPLVGKVAMSPLPSRGSPPLQSGGKIRSGPLVGKVAMSPLPSLGPRLLQSGKKSKVAHLWAKWLCQPCRLGDPHRFRAGGGNQKWPTNGQSGYVTPAVSGIPTAAERGGKSEVAHLWAKWLRHPCRLGDPHRFRAWGEIRSGPQMGKVATSPLPSRGSPPLQSGGGNQKWPTCGQSGYVTPAVSGIPTASERGGKSEVAHLWAKWLRHPCRLGDPHRCRAGGGNRKWPTCGQTGYVTPAALGIPTAAQRGGTSEVAQIRSGPQMGKVATSPLPSRGSPPLQSGGGNQKWPTCGQSGYVTPAVSGIPTAAERGGKSEVAHLWAKWLRHPCRLGDPHRCRAGGEIRSGPLVGKVATSPLPPRGSPPLHSGGGNQKWPTCGQSRYVTHAVSGIPTASERGVKSEVAHKWATWLRHPCRLGDRHRCRAGGEIRLGPLVGKVATSPLPSRGSPPLQSGGEN